jgi:hypothetical protein
MQDSADCNVASASLKLTSSALKSYPAASSEAVVLIYQTSRCHNLEE